MGRPKRELRNFWAWPSAHPMISSRPCSVMAGSTTRSIVQKGAWRTAQPSNAPRSVFPQAGRRVGIERPRAEAIGEIADVEVLAWVCLRQGHHAQLVAKTSIGALKNYLVHTAPICRRLPCAAKSPPPTPPTAATTPPLSARRGSPTKYAARDRARRCTRWPPCAQRRRALLLAASSGASCYRAARRRVPRGCAATGAART